MLTAIVGINWGDEGKGRMVDLLSKDYDVVCRYQGGNNAGHTVINERGRFILNLLPSGILREGVVCVMGPGMVIDIKHLAGEMARLREAGIEISPENLKISDRAVITMPYNVQQDCLEEERLADKKFGSTKRGIAPVYADKYLKKAFRMGELRNPELLKKRLPDIVDWKNLTVVNAYGAEPVSVEGMLDGCGDLVSCAMRVVCEQDVARAEARATAAEAKLSEHDAEASKLAEDNRILHMDYLTKGLLYAIATGEEFKIRDDDPSYLSRNAKNLEAFQKLFQMGLANYETCSMHELRWFGTELAAKLVEEHADLFGKAKEEVEEIRRKEGAA